MTLDAFQKRATEQDAADPLAGFRASFAGMGEAPIYLDGNSLGPLPEATAGLMREAVEAEWGRGLIRSWNAGWYELPRRLGDLLAPLLGAGPGEVIFADSVTVNLFKLAAAALQARPERTVILTDDLNFPSDFYAMEGLIRLLGNRHQLRRVPSADGMTVPAGDLAAAMGADTALVTVSHVVFKSGYLHDLAAITEAAHAAGALVLADLSHSVGSVPVDLEGWGVDLAVGCAYKYLNGGPGAPAFLYVRKGLQERLEPLLAGWFGSAEPFAFEGSYRPAGGISKFLVGTPPILSLKAVEPGIRLLLEAGMDRIRAKSIAQTECFIELWEALLKPCGYRLGSPRDPRRRGSHIALRHPEAYRINRALIEPPEGCRPVIPDFRAPDNLRIGVAPLFLRFGDLLAAALRMRDIVQTREYEHFSHEPAAPVT